MNDFFSGVGDLVRTGLNTFENIRLAELREDLANAQLRQEALLNTQAYTQNVQATRTAATQAASTRNTLLVGGLAIGVLIVAAIAVKEIF